MYRSLGTPNDTAWPGVTTLPDYQTVFPKWGEQPLRAACPDLDEDGLDLLRETLRYDPSSRISARAALRHRYFTATEF